MYGMCLFAVTSWNGTKSQVDRELENDRTTQQRKRNYDQMYDEELDQGKVRVDMMSSSSSHEQTIPTETKHWVQKFSAL